MEKHFLNGKLDIGSTSNQLKCEQLEKFEFNSHEAICIPQICLSKGYRDSSIMHENFNLNLKYTIKKSRQKILTKSPSLPNTLN